MKLNFGRERFTFPITSGRPHIILIASVLLALSLADRSAASAMTLTDMARAQVSDNTAEALVPSVCRGYSSLGLRREAASYLERSIHLAEISRDEAAPLFEEIVEEQSRYEDPGELVAICETAIRNGAKTPLVLYSYGTGLRLTGRLAEASAIFSQVPKESVYSSYALFAIGQIAAEEGRAETALNVFNRVRESVRERGTADFLAKRAARSQAELLLTLGRPGEAAPLFRSLLPSREDPLAEIGLAVVDNGARVGNGSVLPETIARWPVRNQILLSLLEGGLAREDGRFRAALAHFHRAEEKIQWSLASPTPPVAEAFDAYDPVIFPRRLVEDHRILRDLIGTASFSGDPGTTRERIVELLVQLLFIDHSVARAQRSMPKISAAPEMSYLSPFQVEEIFLTIEQVTLEGVDVDRLVEDLARKLDIFQNLAHPIERYRLLTKLEKSQAEIHAIKRRIHERRAAAVAGIEAGIALPMSILLEDVGRFLVELDAIRDAAGKSRAFTDKNFNILRQKREAADRTEDPFGVMVRKAESIDRERFNSLLPAVKALEESARIVSWEQRRQEIAALRPVVARQIVDALVGQARFLRARKTPKGQQEAWSSLEKAASYLRGDALSPRDRVESALQIGSFLEEGDERWEPFPGRVAGERGKEVIASSLPILDTAAHSGELREEASYLLVSLGIMTNDPAARSKAGDFLREFPSSPYAGRIAVRMGHEALLAGRYSDARELYRKAAEGSELATVDAARYMLGWFRFQGGDAAGAAGELSRQLSDPAFRCGEPSPFEQAILALSVRAWRESPLENLRLYAPVREGTCGGRLLLLSLAMDEEKRGEAGRAALVYEVLAERFAGDDVAPGYEKKSVEALLKAGMEDQAFTRILLLEGKYGPGTKWAESRTPEVREKAQQELGDMLKSISERKFAEGVRSGDRKAMVAAKTGMERFFAAKEGERTDEDADLKLKWAVASLKAGDRQTGIAILGELAERGDDSIGERAAVLYAETTIAAYERKEDTAELAERSASLLLARFPSEKAAGLAYRAAAAFLSASEFDRAIRMAEEIEKNKATPKPVLDDARLVHAESAINRNDFVLARNQADMVLGVPTGEGKPGFRERARNLFILASLKEIEAKTGAEDWNGAGMMLEELGRRFPDVPEASQYILRAFRSYRLGGEKEAAARTGMLFLDKYPKRKEAVEIAGAVGPYLIDRGEPGQAADLYASVAERFPKSEEGPDLLFHAARLDTENGNLEAAAKRFSSYRGRYPNPRWKSVYATLSIGLFAWKRGDVRTAIRETEGGIRQMDAGLEKDAPGEIFELGGRARTALGEYWAEQFRKLKLVAPLEKNLAIKDRFFQRALALFEKASEESPIEIAITASQMSGDLFLEFGRSILDSQRPKGLKENEIAIFEEGLKERARVFFENGLAWYVGALDRLEAEKGPADLASPIRERIENAQRLVAESSVVRSEK
jgi:tetratricopeptide (TPR) repeat protein